MKSILLKSFCCGVCLFGITLHSTGQTTIMNPVANNNDTISFTNSSKLSTGQTQTTDEDWLKIGGGTPTSVLNGIYTLSRIGVNTSSPQFTIHSKGTITASNLSNQDKFLSIGHNGTNAFITTQNATELNIGINDNLDIVRIGERNQGDTTGLVLSGGLKIETLAQNDNLNKVAVFDNEGQIFWKNLSLEDKDWLKVGGGNPTNISDKIYTLGSMGVGTSIPDNQFRIHAKGYIASTNYANQNQQLIIGHDGSNAIIRTKNAFRLHVGLGDHLDALILGSKSQGDDTDLIISGNLTTCKVNTSEVEVKTGWCDYVFEEDYDLMSLEETEKFIKKNKHLPNIPPAKEVEENGLQMAAMQVKMMEKIEELTLHIIQLNKKIEELENQE